MSNGDDAGERPEWKRRYLRNTISSYLNTAVRLIVGLIVFRAFFSTWEDAEFGFWALLWSVFGIGVLLDFGLGLTVQKTVAQRREKGDIEGISRLVATVFWSFVGIATALLIAALLAENFFMQFTKVPAEYEAEFRQAYRIFFCGMAVMFPLGIFMEMLNGLQRIDIGNGLKIGNTLIHGTCILIALHSGWGIVPIMLLTVLLSFTPNIVAGIVAFRIIGGGVSLSPKHYDFSALKAQLGFSLIAYLIIFGNLILTKTDQLVIAGVLGVIAVKTYQGGFKVGEMLGMFGSQIESAISPAAAQLSAKGDQKGLTELLLRTTRFMFMMVTPAYLAAAIYLEPLIRLLTDLDTVPLPTYLTGQFILLVIYNLAITASCGRRVLVMSGHEKRLLAITGGHAICNLALSIILAHTYDVAGVALATLISSLVFGWAFFVPALIKFTGVGAASYLSNYLQDTWKGLAAFGVSAGAIHLLAPIPEDSGFVALAWRGTIVIGVAMLANQRELRATWR